MTTLLITRPEEDARALANILEASGVNCLIEPMLAIETLSKNATTLANALDARPAAILLTSKHGALALAAMHQQHGIPILAVGKITADTAIALGFHHVRHAGGTAHQLIDYVRTHHRPQDGELLYACGSDVSVDIAAALAPEHYKVMALPVYQAIAADAFSPQLLASIKAQSLDGALFFSQRSAEAYVELAQNYGVAGHHAAMRALALSEGVADKLRCLKWREIHIASTPDLEGIIALSSKVF